MSITARDSAVNKFNEDSNCRILLMSLKAGGVAVNVTVASHVRICFLSLGTALNSKGLCITFGCI